MSGSIVIAAAFFSVLLRVCEIVGRANLYCCVLPSPAHTAGRRGSIVHPPPLPANAPQAPTCGHVNAWERLGGQWRHDDIFSFLVFEDCCNAVVVYLYTKLMLCTHRTKISEIFGAKEFAKGHLRAASIFCRLILY